MVYLTNFSTATVDFVTQKLSLYVCIKLISVSIFWNVLNLGIFTKCHDFSLYSIYTLMTIRVIIDYSFNMQTRLLKEIKILTCYKEFETVTGKIRSSFHSVIKESLLHLLLSSFAEIESLEFKFYVNRRKKDFFNLFNVMRMSFQTSKLS